MPRMRPETVLLQAEDVLGRVPAEERAQTLSNTIGKLLDAVDDASQGLRFEAEPTLFNITLEELAAERKS
ncbi:MAG: hypothetical protein HOK61_12040 [Alphaproteobacteria bacterium]|jgi:hypothetical protein|nr:hypothetical protein [Alphaproteobacteria bacterium]